MKILLWNINGIRAIIKKKVKPNVKFEEYIKKYDIICLNEIKITERDLEKINILIETHPYQYFAHSLNKKGYSGVSILSKFKPIKKIKTFTYDEGRLIVLEFDTYILVVVYSPNAGIKLKRLDFKLEFNKKFIKLINRLQSIKPIIIAGDLNVAHKDIDLYKPEIHHDMAGFTDEEREDFTNLLDKEQLIDVWRDKHPDKIQYSYFNYRTKARERGNRGWRIDYILVSKEINHLVKKIKIDDTVYGSDHLSLIMNIDI